MPPIANYTTTVPVYQSVQAIVKMLSKAGASSITQNLTKYGGTGGITFVIDTEYGTVEYQLPVRIEGVQATLKRDRVAPRFSSPDHSAKVAWRIAHDWLRAQLALIEAGMTTLPEVMLPYALVAPGQTAFQRFAEQRQGAIES